MQFDIQEPTQVDQTDQRSKLTDTVRRISSIGRYSTPQTEYTRKPFFMISKSPKMVLQTSSSTFSLSKPTRQIIDTPTVYISEENPLREYSPQVVHPPLEVFFPQYSPDMEKQSDFESSQFPDSPHSDTCQSHCHHTDPLTLSDMSLSIPQTPSTSKSTPKFIIRRHKSMETGKKKGSRWKKFMRIHRKGKIEDVMVVEEMIPYTRSSPNLKHFDKTWQSSAKDSPDDDTNSSKEE